VSLDGWTDGRPDGRDGHVLDSEMWISGVADAGACLNVTVDMADPNWVENIHRASANAKTTQQEESDWLKAVHRNTK